MPTTLHMNDSEPTMRDLAERLQRVEDHIATLERSDAAMAYYFPLGAGFGRRRGWQKRFDRSIDRAVALSRLYRERDSLRAAIRRAERTEFRAVAVAPAGSQAAPVKPLLRVTREEWRAKRRDFKGYIHGQPYMLRLDPETGTTVLVPVEIV